MLSSSFLDVVTNSSESIAEKRARKLEEKREFKKPSIDEVSGYVLFKTFQRLHLFLDTPFIFIVLFCVCFLFCFVSFYIHALFCVENFRTNHHIPGVPKIV